MACASWAAKAHGSKGLSRKPRVLQEMASSACPPQPRTTPARMCASAEGGLIARAASMAAKA